MLDPNPGVSQILEKLPSINSYALTVLTGVFLDPTAGPVSASRPAAVLLPSSLDRIRQIDNSATEDIYPNTELDALFLGVGWPSPNALPRNPWRASSTVNGSRRTLGNGTWASRRFMIQRATINLSPKDVRPVDPLVGAFEAALGQSTHDLQIKALQEVFSIWGEMIPLHAVAGASMAVTGILANGTALPCDVNVSSIQQEHRQYSLTEIVDRHLGTTACFERRHESRVEGGSSGALLSEGYEAWLRSIPDNPELWSIVKVYRAVPITDILSDQLQERIKKLFTGSIISRSPTVGQPTGSGFDGGVVAGPYSYASSNPQSQSDTLVLAPGEYVTDIFVWNHHDGWIMGIQFVKNTLELSPVYGLGDRESSSNHPPVLLAGNGKALLGISGAYTQDSLSQVKAVWRNDIILRRQRHTQTSFTGNTKGRVYNDLQHLADPSNARIVQITGRAEGAVASFRTSYVSVSSGSLIRSESPSHGWDVGPLQTITLEEGEYITSVRGSHNYGWMHQIQFITNKKEHPPFGTQVGNVEFNFSAPKTIDGRDMVLHYMAGTSGGCLHSVLLVWAEMPLPIEGA
ncbi:hypothetical protein OPQ81_005052 [Rhizoctonia solani]|nr:hypothetical protein OPQ81_005052 [Rhizoctonia solani]